MKKIYIAQQFTTLPYANGYYSRVQRHILAGHRLELLELIDDIAYLRHENRPHDTLCAIFWSKLVKNGLFLPDETGPNYRQNRRYFGVKCIKSGMFCRENEQYQLFVAPNERYYLRHSQHDSWSEDWVWTYFERITDEQH